MNGVFTSRHTGLSILGVLLLIASIGAIINGAFRIDTGSVFGYPEEFLCIESQYRPSVGFEVADL